MEEKAPVARIPTALVSYPSCARGNAPEIVTSAKDPAMERMMAKTDRFQSSPLFKLAMSKLPNYEVEDTRRLIKESEAHDKLQERPKKGKERGKEITSIMAASSLDIDDVSDEELRVQRVLCRFQNPYCVNPHCRNPELGKRKSMSPAFAKTKVLWCSCCAVVSYCSKDCQRAYHPIHKVWAAALPNAPRLPHNDPMRPSLVNLESGDVYSVDATGQIQVRNVSGLKVSLQQ